MSLKTHSGAKKRLKLTRGGKIKRKKAGLRHLLTFSKAKGQKRKLRKAGYVSDADAHHMKRLLPHG